MVNNIRAWHLNKQDKHGTYFQRERVQVVALVHPYLGPSTNKKSIIDPALGQTHNIKP